MKGASKPKATPWPGAPLTLLLIAIGYLYAFPYFAKLRHANEMPRIALTMQIVDRGTFNLDALVESNFFGSTFDLSHTPGGHHYANKAPGLSFLGVPVYALMRALGIRDLATITWGLRVFVVTLPALAFLWWFRRGIGRFTDDPHAGNTALAAYALGSPIWVYALQFMSHALAAACVGGGFLLAHDLVRNRPALPRRHALLAGLLCGLSIMLEYQAFIPAFFVGVYLLWKSPVRLHDVMAFVLGTLPPGLALAGYHTVCFGSPLVTGYSFHSQVFERGVFGFIGPNPRALHHTLTSPANGLLLLTPWVVLAIAGALAIARDPALRARLGAEAAICLAVVLTYVLYIGSLVPLFARAGWTVGPRHLLAAFPFVVLLSLPALKATAVTTRARAWWILTRALIAFSIAVMFAAVVTYPHWPDYLRNPLFEVSVRMLRSGQTAPSLGTWLGLPGLAALLPLALVTGWAAVRLLRRTGTGGHRDLALAAVIAAVIFAAYSLFPGTGSEAERAWAYIRSTLL